MTFSRKFRPSCLNSHTNFKSKTCEDNVREGRKEEWREKGGGRRREEESGRRVLCVVCCVLCLVACVLCLWREEGGGRGQPLHIFINICCYTFCCIPQNNKFSCLFFLAFPSLVVLLWFVFPWLVLPLFRVRVRVLSCLLFSNRIFKSTSCKRCPSQPNLWPH